MAKTMPAASPAVRAVELRAALAGLLGELPDAHLPKPDLSIVGAEAAAARAELEALLDDMAWQQRRAGGGRLMDPSRARALPGIPGRSR